MNVEQSCVACDRLQLVDVRRVGRAWNESVLGTGDNLHI
jgi:hypothetical protein